MLRFDTLDKKPKLWHLFMLIIVSVLVTLIFASQKEVSVLAIEIIISVTTVLIILFLLIALAGQIRYNPYSYNTIYYIGFSLFFTVGLIEQFIAYAHIRQYHLSGREGVVNLFATMIDSARSYVLFTFPFIAVFALGLCISNIQLIRHEGKRLVNVLGIILSVLLIGGELLLFCLSLYVSGSALYVMIHELFVNILAALYLYFECMLIGAIVANIIVVRYRPVYDKSHIIILGCGIRKDGTPTPLLAGRIDRALQFYKEQIEKTGKAPVFVTSGGQGPNEVTSESAAMTGYLLKKGVPAEHILQEDRSTSTYENMLYSKKVIEEAGGSGKTAFATTNYHVFRSGLMARRVKMRAVGMGARTRWYFWPNAAVREFVGILTEHRLKQALILGGMILLYGGATILFFMGGF